MPLCEVFRKTQEFGSNLALTLPALFVKVHARAYVEDKGDVVERLLKFVDLLSEDVDSESDF